MKRQIFKQLIQWKNSSAARKPLILQGARQVGKTHILKEFGQAEFQNCAYINFEQDTRAQQIFEQDLQPERIIKALELRLETTISAENTLIFFDEIQECPNALNSLKYFCEQTPDYHIVAAGSLLGVKLAHSKGFPVGKVNFLQLHPMGFLEFLQALGKEQLYQHLNQIEKIAPLEDSIHQDLCDLLKTYLFVGGMPEAVKTYQQTQDFHATRQVHEEIIKAYSLDFAKHAPKNQLMKVSLIWESLPAQLAKENKKFVFSKMKPGARTREYETALQWLIDTGLIYPAYNLSTPKLPLKAYQDSSAFKLYCLDVGLLGAMSELSAQTLLDGDKLFTEFKGAISENLAAQLLTIQGTQQLYYWSSGNTAEVDFIIRTNNEIQPLEIKAGTSNKKKSLLVYDNKYQPTQLNRGSLLNLRRDGRLNNYPLYLLEKFPFN